ncbi:uncharacterized protein ISCGN_025081 [Ixodes scapularis]
MSENLRSSGYHCVVFGCSNNFTKRKQNRGKWCDEHEKLQRECGCNVFVLHAFPTEPDLRRKWTASINREGFVPNSSSRVCSDHFIDGKRTECNPVPMLRLGYHRKVLVGRRRLDRVYVPPLKMQVPVVKSGKHHQAVLHSFDVPENFRFIKRMNKAHLNTAA